MCCDRLGDGCKISFPIRMYSKIWWLPVVFRKDECGEIVSKKNSYKELCYVSLSKRRF